jgi:hypothetical protein
MANLFHMVGTNNCHGHVMINHHHTTVEDGFARHRKWKTPASDNVSTVL